MKVDHIPNYNRNPNFEIYSQMLIDLYIDIHAGSGKYSCLGHLGSSYMTYRFDSALPIYAVRVKTNNETNIINTNLPHFWPPIITQTALSQPSDRN